MAKSAYLYLVYERRIEMKNQKDWTGNKNSVFALAGVNRNPETRAFRDLYTTPRDSSASSTSFRNYVYKVHTNGLPGPFFYVR